MFRPITYTVCTNTDCRFCDYMNKEFYRTKDGLIRCHVRDKLRKERDEET